MAMTSKERIQRILKHQPVDRIGLYEHFWNDTARTYHEKGFVGEDESLELHFDLDFLEHWSLNLVADLDYVPEILSETEDTMTIRDGNGAILKRHKHHDTTPEHIGFTVQCGDDWQKIRHFFLEPDERRIDFAGYRRMKQLAAEHNKFFCFSGVNVFETIHPICGHENMLYGMAAEPEWIVDMVEVLSALSINLLQILFAREGLPDGIWYYEDMGYKGTPFMSPAMYRELIMPGHIRTIDFAHSLGLPVIMHSCGFIEPLLPHMIEAGIDCLQVIEIKAGMDLLRIHKEFGDKIVLMGGIDVRKLYGNDLREIDEELEAKIPIVKQGYGFVLHSDHSIPRTVDYETLRYFIEKGLALGQYA